MALPQITTLDNGMRVVSHTDQHVNTIAVGIFIKAGSRYENASNNGIAHFLEHMAFKGTKKRTALDIAVEAENVGAHMNAYTSREQTAYYMRLLKDDLPLAVDILSDIVKNSIFDSEELERERGVIIQEIGQYFDTPSDHVFDIFQDCAYQNQPIGAPILGSKNNVKKFISSDFKDFIVSQYSPEKMVFVCSGHVNHDAFVALVKSEFDNYDNNNIVSPHANANYHGGYVVDTRDNEQVHIVVGFEASHYYNRCHKTYDSLLAQMLGGGMSSRLFQEIREKYGLVYSIYCDNSHYADTGLFHIYAGTSDEKSNQLCDILCHELKNYAKTVTKDELSRAIAQYKSAMMMAMESLFVRSEYMARHLLQYDMITPIDDIMTMINNISLDNIIESANRIFNTKPTIAAVGPTKNLPDYNNFTTAMKAS